MSTIKDYTNLADIKEFWKQSIASNYFDFDNFNNYNIGIFGFVNEVMATAVEDGQSAINIARREFYPISAKYESSFYTMAAVQRIDLPMATPSTCDAILIVNEDNVIQYGDTIDGMNVLDIPNDINIIADKLNFMLDYPVKILSIKNDAGKWTHTTHYDINTSNSLAVGTSKYINNKTARMNGANYIYLQVKLRQVTKTTQMKVVQVNSTVQSVIMDFEFEGQLANFEVRYRENDNSNPIQLKKLLYGQPTPKTPFCYYNLVGRNKIRLTIPKNVYFIPKMNAIIDIDIYLTEGAGGVFPKFTGSLDCDVQTDMLPANKPIIITGQINGAAIGGKDTPDSSEFREEVLDAYATNKTFTTENDLQVYFDSIDRGTNTKFVIKKKRDDFRWRLYGAFCLFRDSANEIIPTNTLNLRIAPEQFNIYYESSRRMILKPGAVFRYGTDFADGRINYDVYKDSSLSLIDDLGETNSTNFLFTNPFLISVTLDPNVVGYYLNSVNDEHPIEYSYVNDKSFIQFIAKNLHIERNAIAGENFYKLYLAVSPSAGDFEAKNVLTELDTTKEENVIRARERGKLVLISYKGNTVYGTFLYEDGVREDLQIGSYVKKEGTEYAYHPGHSIDVSVGEEFQKGSIIARKKVVDKGTLRLVADIGGNMMSGDKYIPFTIESYNSEINYYTFVAYLSTNDYISLNKTTLINGGVCTSDGNDNVNISLPIEDFGVTMYAFYKDPTINYPHQFTRFDYVGDYTLTNSYKNREDTLIRFVKPLSIVRGQVNFEPKTIIVDNPELETDLGAIDFNYDLEIKNVPFLKADWAKDPNNTNEFTDSMFINVNKLESVKRRLENSYTFAMMFFNTYGKSRYFKVGIKEELTTLDSVNCWMNFGVKLVSINTPENTLLDIKKWIKSYVESINDLDSAGKSIFIMNLITDVKNRFSEIDYMEYYGFNNYDYSAQKIQGPSEEEIIAADAEGTYIPEFININYEFDGFIYQPAINLTLLN